MNTQITNQQTATYHLSGQSQDNSLFPGHPSMCNNPAFKLTDRVHSIHDILGRPTRIKQLKWKADQSNNALMGDVSLPQALFDDPDIAAKISGFVGFKATLCVKVYTNAQKKQQGAILAHFIPELADVKRYGLLNATLMTKSSQKSLVYNIEEDAEINFRIPYISQHHMINLVSSVGVFGNLYISVYDSLKAISNTAVSVYIDAWFEDVDLQFPTHNVMTGACPTQAAEETDFQGKLADALHLPDTINEIKPSYLVNKVANIMQLAGYQKKTNTKVKHITSLTIAPNMSNFNGEFHGTKMALAANNTLMKLKNAAGTSQDEMLFSHLLAKPTYFQTAQWSSRAPPRNNIIATIPVHPGMIEPTSTGVYGTTPLSFIGSCFGMWRGSLNYDFQLIKTAEHSGVIRVSFLPSIKYESNDKFRPNFKNCYVETYDLKTTTKFRFTVPYVSTTPYTCFALELDKTTRPPFLDYAIGTLVVEAFSPLLHPDIVWHTISIKMSISGGTDFHFAEPTAPIIFPNLTALKWAPTEEKLVEEDFEMLSTQSADDVISSVNTSPTDLPSAACTGEVIKSVKNLCSRAGVFANFEKPSGDVVYTFRPFMNQTFIDRTVTPSDMYFDYIDYFSWLYAYMNGGLRFLFNPNNTVPTTMRAVMRTGNQNYYNQTSRKRASLRPRNEIKSRQPGRLMYPFSTQYFSTNLQGIASLEIPYYGRAHIMPVQHQLEDSADAWSIATPSPIWDIYSTTAQTTAPEVMRMCADDFRMYYFVGCPTVCLLPSAEKDLPLRFQYIPHMTTNVYVDTNAVTFENALTPYEQNFFMATQIIGATKSSGLSVLPSNQLAYFTHDESYVSIKVTNASRYLVERVTPTILVQNNLFPKSWVIQGVLVQGTVQGADHWDSKPATINKSDTGVYSSTFFTAVANGYLLNSALIIVDIYDKMHIVAADTRFYFSTDGGIHLQHSTQTFYFIGDYFYVKYGANIDTTAYMLN